MSKLTGNFWRLGIFCSSIWVVSFISGYKKCLQRSWAKDHVNFHDVDATWLHCDCVVGMHLQCFAQIDIDIGTTFLYFQCFFTTDMFLFCKTILYSGNCRIFRDLAFGSIKTRFKAILKKLDFSAQIDFSAHIYFFHEFLPPEGDFSAQIYFFNELLPPEGDFSAHIYVFATITNLLN